MNKGKEGGVWVSDYEIIKAAGHPDVLPEQYIDSFIQGAKWMRSALISLVGHGNSDAAPEQNKQDKWTDNDDRKLKESYGYYEADAAPDGWISCEDRLPEDYEDKQVWIKGEIIPFACHYLNKKYFIDNYEDESYMDEGWYYSHSYQFSSDEPITDVTHWQPLPKPPKAEP